MNFKINGNVGNYSIASREVVDVIKLMSDRLRFYGGMLFWTGYPHTVVDFHRGKRLYGVSGYNFWRRLRLAVLNVFAYSSIPLQLSAFAGLAVMLLALCLHFTLQLDFLFTTWFQRVGRALY